MTAIPPLHGVPEKTDAPEPATLIDSLLAEQRQLTAVEEFSRAHDRHELREPHYQKLLPVTAPQPGQQLAFEVDLDKCSGCKACVTACHSLNGLDDGEAWREVGTLVSDDWRRPARHTVTTACHHCVDPGCLNGCPVLAYEKDSVTGIVCHLDDQCIGCEYCVMKCPYDVPKYSAHRGIVRKCDMCSQRLAVGEAPACAQACPNEAIRITVVDQSKVRGKYRQLSTLNSQPFAVSELGNDFLPASPNPAITLPTTRFISRKHLAPDLIPSDAAEVKLQPPHWPLAWMLVLTQLGVGALAALPLLPPSARPVLALLALAATLAGLAVSVSHLGRPTRAWRAFLGLRKSWLSREIVVFGLFAPLALTVTGMARFGFAASLVPAVLGITVAAGLLGVLCSGMVYHDTRRALWRGARSVGRFFGTTAVLGLAAAWMVAGWNGVPTPWPPLLLALAMTVKLAGEQRLFLRAGDDAADEVWPKDGNFDRWSLAHSAVLMRDQLGLLTRLRFACGVVGGVALPLLGFLPMGFRVTIAGAAFALCAAGELAERHLFFRVVVPPRMPGAA